jgi:hypothetical protein
MSRAFRVFSSVLIIVAFSFVVGCGDDPVSTKKTPTPEPEYNGEIGVFSDAAGTNPNIVDTGGDVTLYVVHTVEGGAAASAFRIEAPTGWTLVVDPPEVEFPLSIGDIDDGISVAYGGCETGAIHVMTLTYHSPGTTPAGATFKVLPNLQWPDHVQMVDCSDNLLNSEGLETPVVVP